MELTPDLDQEAVERLLPRRRVRSYPAVLSTEADALAWARAGAVSGSVVVADYQASPRGRGGLPWEVAQGTDLGFSVVLRPDLPDRRQGWLYSVAAVAVSDVIGDTRGGHVAVRWPDQITVDGHRAAAVGVTADLDVTGVRWAVINVVVHDVDLPRGPVLARLVTALEERLEDEPEPVLDVYRSRCATLGQPVRARLIPMGPAGVEVEGVADDLLPDGALVIESRTGARVAVLPHHLGMLDDLPGSGPVHTAPATSS